MIQWTNEFLAQIDSYSRAALSYRGESGYPVTLPLPFTFDLVAHSFALPKPEHLPSISAKGEGETSLTLLRYDPQVVNERYLLFYGQLAEHGDEWSFTPSRVMLPQWGSRREA
jgi:hypothetical protein